MGNDGGSIPKRSEMVKVQKKKHKGRNQGTGAGECSLTKEPLQPPLVACQRGLIYNKEPLIKSMIEKTLPYEFRHIRRLANLIQIQPASFDQVLKQVTCAVTQMPLTDTKRFLI